MGKMYLLLKSPTQMLAVHITVGTNSETWEETGIIWRGGSVTHVVAHLKREKEGVWVEGCTLQPRQRRSGEGNSSLRLSHTSMPNLLHTAAILRLPTHCRAPAFLTGRFPECDDKIRVFFYLPNCLCKPLDLLGLREPFSVLLVAAQVSRRQPSTAHTQVYNCI